MPKKGQEKRFWDVAIGVMALISLLNYLPVFWGQVPFPRDVVMQHSAWAGQATSSPKQQVAQLIDIVAMFYPFRALNAIGAQRHELPLWNPFIQSGAPFQANAQSALFNPLGIFYYFLPLKMAWTADLILRLFLSGLFMTAFVRTIGGSPLGSLVAGILFALCGFTVQWQGMSNGESGIWLPLICYSVVRLYQRPQRRSVAIAAFAFAAPVLSGHPETAAHSTMVGCVIALFLLVQRFNKRFLIGFVAAGLLALGLAAVQVIPTIEWLGRLGPQLDNAQPVLDRHQGQGFFSRDILRDPNSAGIAIPEGSAYVGMLGLLAACLAPFHKSRSYVLFFAILALVATAVAFGFQPIRWVVVHLPVIKAMKNARLIMVANFAIAALAGLGISTMDGPELGLPRRKAFWYLTLASLTICFCIYELHRATLSPVELMRSPAASLVFLACALVLLGMRLNGLFGERVFTAAIIGLCAFEMLTFSYGYLGFTPTKEVFPPAPVFDFLQSRADLRDYRVTKDRFPIPHDAGIIYGFEAADGYDLTTERTRNFTADLAEDRPDGVMFVAEKLVSILDRRLDMLNVKYLLVSVPSAQADLFNTSRFRPIYTDRSVAVFENPTALTRVWLIAAKGIEVISDDRSQLERLKQPSFDPERSVVFPVRPNFVHENASDAADVSSSVVVRERTLNTYQLEVKSTEPAAVVLSQMFYPGWNASVNGRDLEIYPVDYALTGFVVSAGTSDVRLMFRPSSFVFGATISLMSVVATLVLLV
jgi:hypothetical protein